MSLDPSWRNSVCLWIHPGGTLYVSGSILEELCVYLVYSKQPRNNVVKVDMFSRGKSFLSECSEKLTTTTSY